MVDIDDEYAEDLSSFTEETLEEAAEAAPAAAPKLKAKATPSLKERNAKAAAESPLIKIIETISAMLGGSKKQPAAKKAATANAAPVTAGTKQNGEGADTPTEPKKAEPYGDALMTVVVRNEFYRDGFRNMVRLALAQAIVIIVILLTFVAYTYAVRPQDRYFATTADGRIMRLVPLNLPNMSTSALMSWVAQSVSEVMTFGYHDYQRRLQNSSRHFTRYGWESFTNALQKSHIIESVEAAKQVVTAQPASAPVLIQEGVFNGKYRWVVDLPLEVAYKSASAGRTDNLMIRLVIDRVTSLENPNGVGIEQWIATAK